MINIFPVVLENVLVHVVLESFILFIIVLVSVFMILIKWHIVSQFLRVAGEGLLKCWFMLTGILIKMPCFDLYH